MSNIFQDDKVKTALVDLMVSILHGLKIFFVFIVPSVVVSVLLSPELMNLFTSNPSLLAYAPIANLIFSVVASLIKARLPEGSSLKAIL